MNSTNSITPSLLSLPPEIKQIILCSLPDLHALKAAILSHSSIHLAFLDRPESIGLRVLLNVIPSALLPDAVLALDASTIEGWTWSNRAMTQDWTRERVISILDRHRNYTIPESIPLKDAFSMQKLYNIVKVFASDFISAALSRNPALPQYPPSSREWARVARSFYRFEVHRHLFRSRDIHDYFGDSLKRKKDSPDFLQEEQWEVCYKHYAVWELEQLAAISEYLYRILAVPFNRVAEHDISWGSQGVHCGIYEAWESNPRRGYVQGLLSNGLEFILRATKTPGYEQLRRLLKRNLKSLYPYLPGQLQFIYPKGVDETPLKDYTAEQSKMLQTKPESPEPDPGPFNIWTWSHLMLDWDQFVCSIHCRELRAWGYVMWDNERLEDSGVFSRSFTLPPLPDEEELQRRKDAIISSMTQRHRLHDKGADGWWAEGDESQLNWGEPLEYSDEEDFREEQYVELIRETLV